MKKIIVLFIVILTVVISSCKKDENNDLANLTGSTWVGQISSDGQNLVYTIKFSSHTACSLTAVVSGVSISLTGTYTYEPPDVVLEFQVDEGGTLSGTINGNSMVLNDSGEYLVFTKQ